MSASKAYRPLARQSLAWKIMRLVLAFFGRRAQRSARARASGRGSSVDAGIANAFGAEPDLEARHEVVRLPSNLAVLFGAALLVIGMLLSLFVGALGVGAPASAIPIRVLGAFSSFPFALVVPWSVRAVVSELHYHRWVSSGRPVGELPPARSQPLDSDVLLALPAALVLAWVFLSA